MEHPVAVRRTSALLAVEGVALAVTAVGFGALGDRDDAALAASIAGAAVVGAVLLLLLARAVRRDRGWARTPAVVLQIIALLVATDLAKGRTWVAAAVVALLAGATLFHLTRLHREE